MLTFQCRESWDANSHGGSNRKFNYREGRHRMKIITLVIALICLSQAALADGLSTPTPSPSPAYVNPLGRRGGIRRTERAERRETYQSAANSRAQTRGQRKADRGAAATQAQAARAREQAQR